MTLIIHDAIYNEVQLEDYIWKLIDTRYFQRLKYLRQNGNAYKLYPSANHTRFEHSIGVYHLTNKLIQNIQNEAMQQITCEGERAQYMEATKLVKIAALLHDIGHGPFSHMFESVLQNIDVDTDHEAIGCIIINKMLIELEYSQNQIQIIKQLILGEIIDMTIFKKFAFLNSIVCNQISSMDTDKLDYLNRDSTCISLPIKINADKIINNCHIYEINNCFHLCYSINVRYEIQQVFSARYGLHRLVYQNPRNLAGDFNCLLCLTLAHQLKIVDFKYAIDKLQSSDEDWFDNFENLDDNIINVVQMSIRQNKQQNKETYAKLVQAISQYKSQTIYQPLYQLYANSTCFNINASELQHKLNLKLEVLSQDKSYVSMVRQIHYGMGKLNPVESIAFKSNNKIMITMNLITSIKQEQFIKNLTQIVNKQNFTIEINDQVISQMTTPSYFTEYGIFIFQLQQNENCNQQLIKQAIQTIVNENVKAQYQETTQFNQFLEYDLDQLFSN